MTESCVLELREMGREWDLLLVKVRWFQLLELVVVLQLLLLLLDVGLRRIIRGLFVRWLGFLVLLDTAGGLGALDDLNLRVSKCLFLWRWVVSVLQVK